MILKVQLNNSPLQMRNSGAKQTAGLFPSDFKSAQNHPEPTLYEAYGWMVIM